MSCRSAGKDQLSITTVFDYLSSIKSCFSQAGISFTWPDLVTRIVKNEGSMRRRLGGDISAAKLPFMPRLAELLDRVLQTGGLELGVHRACAAVVLCFYFGWRSSTVAVLCSSDVTVNHQLQVVTFSERFSKGAF